MTNRGILGDFVAAIFGDDAIAVPKRRWWQKALPATTGIARLALTAGGALLCAWAMLIAAIQLGRTL